MAKALFVVDVQQWGFAPYEGRLPDADDLLPRLKARLYEAREQGLQVVHVQNDGEEPWPDAPGGLLWPMMFEPVEGEIHVRKTTQDTFESNPELAELLRGRGIDEIEMIGCQSEMCVRSTALGALAAGFKVSVPAGLHGTYDADGKTANQIKAEVDAELATKLAR